MPSESPTRPKTRKRWVITISAGAILLAVFFVVLPLEYAPPPAIQKTTTNPPPDQTAPTPEEEEIAKRLEEEVARQARELRDREAPPHRPPRPRPPPVETEDRPRALGSAPRPRAPEPAPRPSALDAALLEVDNFLQSLPLGSVAFHVPTTMHVDEAYIVHFVVSGGKTTEELQQGLRQKLEGNPEVAGGQAQISPRMKATLTGHNFEIDPITPETQPVGMQSETEWRWAVTPKRGGKQSLHLTLDAIVLLWGDATPRAIRTFDNNIEVQVSWQRRAGDFLKNNWQWLWSVVVVPLALWLWPKLQSRKRRHPTAGFR
jgi:hypothetical protein